MGGPLHVAVFFALCACAYGHSSLRRDDAVVLDATNSHQSKELADDSSAKVSVTTDASQTTPSPTPWNIQTKYTYKFVVKIPKPGSAGGGKYQISDLSTGTRTGLCNAAVYMVCNSTQQANHLPVDPSNCICQESDTADNGIEIEINATAKEPDLNLTRPVMDFNSADAVKSAATRAYIEGEFLSWCDPGTPQGANATNADAVLFKKQMKKESIKDQGFLVSVSLDAEMIEAWDENKNYAFGPVVAGAPRRRETNGAGAEGDAGVGSGSVEESRRRRRYGGPGFDASDRRRVPPS
jgi:hypothetical protein